MKALAGLGRKERKVPKKMRDREGKLWEEDEKVKECWQKAWESLGIEDREDSEFNKRYYRKLNDRLEMRRNDGAGIGSDRIIEENEDLDKSISIEEIRNAVRKLKKGKATGEDEILNETLKYGGEVMINVLHYLFNMIWTEERIPDQWGRAVVTPLYKKGDKHDPLNYRGISLMSCR